MLIEKFKDKNGRVPTNIELIKSGYNQLVKLRDGIGCKNETEKEKAEEKFYRICGGSDNADQIMRYLEQIVDVEKTKGEYEAQRLLARSLIGVKGGK